MADPRNFLWNELPLVQLFPMPEGWGPILSTDLGAVPEPGAYPPGTVVGLTLDPDTGGMVWVPLGGGGAGPGAVASWDEPVMAGGCPVTTLDGDCVVAVGVGYPLGLPDGPPAGPAPDCFAGGETDETAATVSGTNRSGGTIAAGMAVAPNPSPAGYTTAHAGPSRRPAVGLAVAASPALGAVTAQTEGPLTLADWTAATGAAALTTGAVYFLDPAMPGRLTATPPATAGLTVQSVGEAVTTDTLLIEVEDPILL